MLRLGYLLQGIGLGITPFMPNLPALFGASTLFAVGTGLANPTLNTLCSEATPEPRQGEMFGLLQSARSFGFLFGPILGGFLFDWRPASPYLLAASVSIAVGLLAAFRQTGPLMQARVDVRKHKKLHLTQYPIFTDKVPLLLRKFLKPNKDFSL